MKAAYHLTGQRPSSFRGQRPWFISPGCIFYATWLGVWFLYTMHLSNVLLFPPGTVSRVEIPILGAFLPFLLIARVFPMRDSGPTSVLEIQNADTVLRKRLRNWLYVWIAVTIFEIIISGGVPLLWTLTGSSKDYFMFGIPTLHGLMNALILAISITRFGLGLRYGRRSDLLFALFLVVWSIVIEARQLTIVAFLEVGFLFLMYRRVRLKRVVGGLAAIVGLIVFFGIAGDLRSGGDAFRQLAQPTDRYPEWLPSGFLWFYIYMTTPLNNLVNTWMSAQPLGDFTLPNTLAELIPTAVRNALGMHGIASTFTGELVTEAFNVSTAYIGPMQDLGLWGVMGFSAFVAFTSGLCWLRKGFRNDLIFAVLGQCLFLSVFFNHFFYLPIIAQIGWVYVFFFRRGEEGKRISEGIA